MKKNWKELRITLLLYLLILIVPIGTYLDYRSYRELRETVAMLEIMVKVPESILIVEKPNELRFAKEFLTKNQKDLERLKQWMIQHSHDKDYVGGGSLAKQYELFEQCWRALQKGTDKNGEKLHQCIQQVHSLVFALERMVALKNRRFENLLLVTAAIEVLLLLLGIYFVRLYIGSQIRRRAIHDFETTLYNSSFVEESFKKMCARSKRYGYPMTVMRIWVEEFSPANSSLDKQEQEKLLHRFGTDLWEEIRESDVAARTEDGSFILLLPHTTAEEATVVEQRIREKIGNRITLTCRIFEIDGEQSCESASSAILH